MAGQGQVIRDIASLLKAEDWDVIFVCIPNSAHEGVVPIPTLKGSTKQRYPDILSCRKNILRLTEVEISLSASIAKKAIERFSDMSGSLSSKDSYLAWSQRVLGLTGKQLPVEPNIICELVVCTKLEPTFFPMVAELKTHGVSTIDKANFIVDLGLSETN